MTETTPRATPLGAQSALPRITAVIKARNEAAQIAMAIESALSLADEVIVVDDRSTDDTAAIAADLGARVLAGLEHHGRIDLLDRQGFGAVSTGWILRMDADERLTPALAAELRRATLLPNAVAVSYARLNHMFGDVVRHGGWFDPHQRGFFRADSWQRDWDGGIHSQVPLRTGGDSLVIDPDLAWMIHLDYSNIDTFIERTLRRYAAAEAAELAASGARFSRRRILIDPFIRTWGRYFIRRGYRDGDRGLVLAGLLGAYDLARWSLVWELQEGSDD
jgi:glycosyltransferase involved in cell wall biosynthesis